MGLKEHCTVGVGLEHLDIFQRREAATWAIEKFGIDNVDIVRPMMSAYGDRMIPCFWFAREKDANWFLLRWSK